MDKINWGIIGCGDVTEVKSGPAFNKVPNSRLVGVMRRDAAKAQDYAQRHNVPRWYDNAAALIADPEINAIYVATPPSSHEEYALAAINAGKPVYVEKPMTLDYASAQRMAAAAANKKIKLVVAHYRREQPRFKKVKQLLEEKAVGDPLLVRLELFKSPMTNADKQDPGKAWRVNPAISGGGIFHDLAPHQLDLLTYFFGPAEKVTGIAANQRNNYPADDLVVGNILYKNGVAFSGAWCFNAAPSDIRDNCEIIGTKGRIQFAVFSTDTITVEAGDFPAITFQAGQSPAISAQPDQAPTVLTFNPLPHVQQPMIAATVEYFLGKGPNPNNATDGAEVMRQMEAITAR